MASFRQKAGTYLRLMRVDRPIGTILVLMPTLWSLWIASRGRPSFLLVMIFTLGCFLMRSAGCVVNDIADRKFDRFVSRTRIRPIASGEVPVKEGLILFLLLAAISFILILPLNYLTIFLSFIGLLLAVVYPFTKRWIHVPQFVLGISFGWGAVMAWAAVKNTIELPAILIFTANIFWSLAYDTIYALMDREDDIKIGIKSTAILFGNYVWMATGFSLFFVLLFLVWAGLMVRLGLLYYIMLALVGMVFARQVADLRKDSSPELAFRLFKNHGGLGFLIFAGIVLDYMTR